MKNTQLLLINDMCGYGKVALSAMLPVLSHMGYRIHNLPTALVSDTLNYPKFYIHDQRQTILHNFFFMVIILPKIYFVLYVI